MTVRAIWNDTILAGSDDTVVLKGNHYSPRHWVGVEVVES